MDIPFMPLSTRIKARPIVTCDIETAGLDATPEGFRMGVVYDGRTATRFTDVNAMRGFLLIPKFSGHTIYAHNGGKYDYLSIFGNLWTFFGPENVTLNDGNFIQAVWRDKHRATYFRDSLRIIPTSLAKIGERFGFPKGKTPLKFIPIDEEVRNEAGEKVHGEYVPGSKIVLEESDWEYCIRDCEVLHKALSFFQERLGALRPTLPSTAMAVFRREFFPSASPIRICRSEDLAFRDAYYGGRVEAYVLGRLSIPNWTYDKNSLYPKAMVSVSFPSPEGLTEKTNVTPRELVDDLFTGYEGFASVTVKHPESELGYLPWVSPTKKLLFPIGTFGGSWCFPELREFVKLGGSITEVSRVIYAPRMPSPFGGYVDRYFKMKQEAQGFEREMAKLMLNALYGKFGEYHELNHRYGTGLDPALLEEYRTVYGTCDWEPISRTRDDGYYVFPSRDGGIAGHSVFSWAAYITSQARVLNLRDQLALRKIGQVYYTDTDSFTTNVFIGTDVPPDRMPLQVGDGLGELKLESQDKREIRGNKYYVLADGSTVLKGVRKGAKLNSRGNYEWKSVMGLREAIRTNKTPGAAIVRERFPRAAYDKRIVLPDGSTKPIRLGL